MISVLSNIFNTAIMIIIRNSDIGINCSCWLHKYFDSLQNNVISVFPKIGEVILKMQQAEVCEYGNTFMLQCNILCLEGV